MSWFFKYEKQNSRVQKIHHLAFVKQESNNILLSNTKLNFSFKKNSKLSFTFFAIYYLMLFSTETGKFTSHPVPILTTYPRKLKRSVLY